MEDHLKECEFEKIKGFLKYNQIQMNEIKSFLLQKEDENRRLKESLVDLHRKFDQVLNLVEITNGSFSISFLIILFCFLFFAKLLFYFH